MGAYSKLKRKCNKARFLYKTLKKTPSSGGFLIISHWSFCGREWGGVGANSRLGAYSNKYGIFSDPQFKIFMHSPVPLQITR